MKKKIVITGGEGRFAQVLKRDNKKLDILYPSKKELNILNINSINKYLKKNKPKYLIHAAALSRPMNIHNKNISKSIAINIMGTCNLVKICEKYKIKLIYFSTSYVYPGSKGNYSEKSNLNPINSYAWSKLGGECATKLCKNHLILRLCMTDDNYPHEIAYDNYITSFIRKTDAAKKLLKLINKNGIINLGGPTQTAYKFAKKNNKNVKRGLMNKGKFKLLGKNTSINLTKLKKYNV